MNKNYLISALALSVLTIISFTRLSGKAELVKEAYKKSHLLNSNGSVSGRTGAPGEASCTSCHSGTVQSGTSMNTISLVIDGTSNTATQYVPGTIYAVSLTINSAAAKKGFQAVALKTSDNTQAGTITAIAGSTSTASFQNKTYVNHTSASNSQSVFHFKWTAPATDVGNVKFYIASNVSNSNGSSTGDQIFISNVSIPIAPPVAGFSTSSTSVCVGNPLTLTSTSTNSPTTLFWNLTSGTPSTASGSTATVTYTVPGIYDVTLTATNSSGTTTASSQISVLQGAVISQGAITEPTACSATDGSVTINGSESGTLTFSGPVSGTMNASLPLTVNNLSAGIYSFNMDNGSACPSSPVSVTLSDPGATIPTITSSDADQLICLGTSLTLSSSAATTYLWSTGETTQNISVASAGDYFVTATQSGCTATSSLTTVSVVDCAGIPENENSFVVLYPSPATNLVTVKNLDPEQFNSIQLEDLQGKIIQSWKIDETEEKLYLKNTGPGSYFIKISGNRQQLVKALVIL